MSRNYTRRHFRDRDEEPQRTEVCVVVKRTTEKAILVSDGVHPDAWLPLSQIAVIDDGGVAKSVSLPIWLAKEKGLV